MALECTLFNVIFRVIQHSVSHCQLILLPFPFTDEKPEAGDLFKVTQCGHRSESALTITLPFTVSLLALAILGSCEGTPERTQELVSRMWVLVSQSHFLPM